MTTKTVFLCKLLVLMPSLLVLWIHLLRIPAIEYTVSLLHDPRPTWWWLVSGHILRIRSQRSYHKIEYEKPG